MNTLSGAEAKANRTLGVRCVGRWHPQASQPQGQVMRDFPAPLLGGHALGIECVLHVHGGQSPVSKWFAYSAKPPPETMCGKLRAFAEKAYLCDTIEVIPGVASVDLGQMEHSLTRHFSAMNRLCEQLAIPDATVTRNRYSAQAQTSARSM